MIWTSHEKACETDSNLKATCNYLSYLTGCCSYQWPHLRSMIVEASDLAGPETWRVVEHTGPSIGPLFAASCMYVCMYVICMNVWMNEFCHNHSKPHLNRIVWKGPPLVRASMNLCRTCLNLSRKLQCGPRHLPIRLWLAPSCAGNL